MTPKSRALKGNRRASKPADQRRVALSLTVKPQTRALLESLAEVHGSLGAVVDHLAIIPRN